MRGTQVEDPVERQQLSADGPGPPVERRGRAPLVVRFDVLLRQLIVVEQDLQTEQFPGLRVVGAREVLDGLRNIARQLKAQPFRPQDSAGVRAPQLGMVITGRLGCAGECMPGAGQVLLLGLNDHLFSRLGAVADLDPLAEQLLWSYQPALAAWWLADGRALFAPSHPARQLLELLVRVSRGLDSYSGLRAQALAEQIRVLALDSVQRTRHPESLSGTATRDLVEVLNRYWREMRPQEERLMARERGLSSLSDAQQRVAGTLADAMAGRALPRAVVEFLRDVWAKYLRITYLREGVASEAWRAAVAVIGDLLDSVTNRDGEALKQGYRERINPLIERLRRGAASVHAGQSVPFATFLQQLDAVHLAIMEGVEPDPRELVSLPAEPGAAAGGPPDAQQAQQAPGLERVHGLRIGGWYRWSDQGRAVRARLVENNRDRGYLLLDNLSGIKVVRLGYLDAAQALVEGRLVPIDARPVFDALLQRCLDDWRVDLERRRGNLEQLRLDRTAREAQSARSAEQRDRERLELVRLQAHERAREAAQREAEERRQAEAAHRAEAEQALRRQAIASKVEEVQRMQPGAMLELIDGGQQRIVCELALVLRSSRKMIFVDRFGKRAAELDPGDLAGRVVDGSAQILSFGLTFHQTLERVIDHDNRLGRKA